MEKINNISADNIALNYIEKRILEDTYRGRHISQHNRFNFEDTLTILEIIDKIDPPTTKGKFICSDIITLK